MPFSRVLSQWQLGVALALALGACTGNTTPPPTVGIVTSARPSPRPPYVHPTVAPQGVAKCQTDDETVYTAAGWRGPRIEILASHFVFCDAFVRLLSVDPTRGDWRIDLGPNLDLGEAISDGQSVLVPSDSGTSLLEQDGSIARVVPPPALKGGWGYRPTAYGGYIAFGYGATIVAHLGDNGMWLPTEPLPAGYVVAGPTSEPDDFILARAEAAEGPYSLSNRDPFTAYLWNRRTGGLSKVAEHVGMIESSSVSLAYLVLADGSHLSVDAHGKTTGTNLGADDPFRSLDGRAFLDVPDEGALSSQTIELRDAVTKRVLSTYLGVYGIPAWFRTSAAFVPRADNGASEVVILTSAGVSTVPLPTALIPQESEAP